ncbi:hypothetical protein V8E55_008018 [Tylopilus felleus]
MDEKSQSDEKITIRFSLCGFKLRLDFEAHIPSLLSAGGRDTQGIFLVPPHTIAHSSSPSNGTNKKLDSCFLNRRELSPRDWPHCERCLPPSGDTSWLEVWGSGVASRSFSMAHTSVTASQDTLRNRGSPVRWPPSQSPSLASYDILKKLAGIQLHYPAIQLNQVSAPHGFTHDGIVLKRRCNCTLKLNVSIPNFSLMHPSCIYYVDKSEFCCVS